MHAEGIAASLAHLPPARLAEMEPRRQPSPRAGQAREEKGARAVHRALVSYSQAMAGTRETRESVPGLWMPPWTIPSCTGRRATPRPRAGKFSGRALGSLRRCFGGVKIFSLLVSKLSVILVFQREDRPSPNEGQDAAGGRVPASLAALMWLVFAMTLLRIIVYRFISIITGWTPGSERSLPT